MDDRVLAGTAVVAVLISLLVLMYLGWRRRQRHQTHLPRPLAVPPDMGSPVLSRDVFYVASTVVDEPLNRVAVSGLGFRARAVVTVVTGGLVLRIPGEPDAFLPAADLIAVSRSTWTIDRVVETGGLVKVTWRLGSTAIDTYLRVMEPADQASLIDAIDHIIETPSGVRNEER
ncbi:MAG TPA: hypothetical protein VGP10_01085 [Marisediminicola sp.]|nr:hypothetical protein [Marisediminicola sp.]